MVIEVLLVGMAASMARSPQITQDSSPACTVSDEQPCDSHPAAPTRWITDLDSTFALSGKQSLGQRISVRDVRVSQVNRSGFWIAGRNVQWRLFIVPAEGSLIHVEAGDVVSLQGEFRRQTRTRGLIASVPDAYVYAYIVRKAPQ